MADRKASKTGTGVVQSHRGYYHGYIITTALGAGAITLYDNASAASGTVVNVIAASAPVGATIFATPVPLDNGLYANFASTGTVLFLTD